MAETVQLKIDMGAIRAALIERAEDCAAQGDGESAGRMLAGSHAIRALSMEIETLRKRLAQLEPQPETPQGNVRLDACSPVGDEKIEAVCDQAPPG